MSATTIQTRIEELLATGLTFTQIKKIIETKAKRLPEGPDKLELRRAWKQVDRMANPRSSAAETATTLIANRQPATDWPQPFVDDERAMQDAEADRSGTIRDETAKHAARAAMEKTTKVIRPGTYTIVMAGGEHRTIRIKKHWDAAEEAKGTLVAQFLSGADNESSYTGFAFISATGRVITWKRFRTGFNTINSALAYLLQSGDYEECGMRYALESGNCCKCGRKLTVPASIHRGMGPKCAAGGRD